MKVKIIFMFVIILLMTTSVLPLVPGGNSFTSSTASTERETVSTAGSFKGDRSARGAYSIAA